jgi:hypothetical protein
MAEWRLLKRHNAGTGHGGRIIAWCPVRAATVLSKQAINCSIDHQANHPISFSNTPALGERGLSAGISRYLETVTTVSTPSRIRAGIH